MVKNMWGRLHVSHKTCPAVISARLTPVAWFLLQISRVYPWWEDRNFWSAFGKRTSELEQITCEIFSLTLCLSFKTQLLLPKNMTNWINFCTCLGNDTVEEAFELKISHYIHIIEDSLWKTSSFLPSVYTAWYTNHYSSGVMK